MVNGNLASIVKSKQNSTTTDSFGLASLGVKVTDGYVIAADVNGNGIEQAYIVLNHSNGNFYARCTDWYGSIKTGVSVSTTAYYIEKS